MNLQKSYLLAVLIFSSMCLIPIQLCVAETPDYVGFEEDQEFVWDINFDKELAEDVIEDYFDSIYSYDDDEKEEFNDAVELSLGDNNDLSIAADDEKWYKIDVNQNQNLTVSLIYDNSDDLDLDLVNKNNYYLGIRDSYPSGSQWIETCMTLTSYSGYYYLEIENWESYSTSFNISISIGGWSNNHEFNSEGSYPGYSINEDEKQIYKITDVAEGKNLSISIFYNDDIYTLDLDLYDDTIDQIAYDDSFDGGDIIWEVTSYEGDYYFVVESYSSSSVAYDIEIEISDPSESGSSSSYSSPADLFIDILDEYDDVKGLKITIDDIDEEESEIIDLCIIDADVEYSVDMIEWKDLDDEYEDYYEDEFGSTAPDLSYVYQILIPDPDDIDENNYYGLVSGYLFSPVGLDWEDIEGYVDNDYKDSQLDFDAETNGFKAKTSLVGDMDEFEITVQYNAQGVLQYMQILYGGIEVGTIRSNFLSTIITISIIAVVAGVAVIGLVALYMKRKSKFDF